MRGTYDKPAWPVGVPLLVECPGCGSRAVCKLEEFSPDDLPVCPACDKGIELKVIRTMVEPPSAAHAPHPKMSRRN